MITLENEPMSKHTSFRVGGCARYFFKAESAEDIREARSILFTQGLPYFILGNGTNLLVSDKGFEGGIITLGQSFSNIEELGSAQQGTCTFKAGAGISLGSFARKSIKLGLEGIHKLAGVPGSMGGAVYMNAGAYGEDISQTCVSVESLDADGHIVTRKAGDCEFSYRHSIFQEFAHRGNPETILSATFQLNTQEVSHKDSATLEAEMQECMAKRKATQPLSMPNAGSTFKRLSVGSAAMPQQIAPGYYIEQAGLKGYRMGGAEVSTVHANFIVNAGGATAQDIKNLSEHVQKTVAEKFGVQLQREIILLGEF